MLDVPPPHPAHVRVCARPNAPPVASGPVAEVVPASGTSVTGPVRDLVPAQARVAQRCVGLDVFVRQVVVVGHRHLASAEPTGEVSMPDDDDLADKYVQTDTALGDAGLGWYEVSNWARDAGARCRHNLSYWTGGHWWGVGPGAHSHVGGVRWWNVKHPTAYAGRVESGVSPAHAREVLDDETRRVC